MKSWHWPLRDNAFFQPARRFTMQTSQPQRQRCEVWTRVMGYHRPVSAFNPGKQSEHKERVHFTESAAVAARQ
jgi:anaerobic ribonucleoside-triphosphate reductase